MRIFAILGLTVLLHTNALAFGPCSNSWPEGVSYLPEVSQCGGKAAIVVFGKYLKSFSAVVRDCNNDDRDPCDKGPQSCGSNASSPYKAQKIVRAKIVRRAREFTGRIFCLKERGDSEIYKLVRRATIKLKNPVRSSRDVLKLCMKTRTSPIRNVSILDTIAEKDISNTGYSRVCDTQQYLACSISYEDRCPSY